MTRGFNGRLVPSTAPVERLSLSICTIILFGVEVRKDSSGDFRDELLEEVVLPELSLLESIPTGKFDQRLNRQGLRMFLFSFVSIQGVLFGHVVLNITDKMSTLVTPNLLCRVPVCRR